ncbi:site-specific integrase [Sinorhizobium alkalisoli]|uniref:site-specific integrase n=1 Tax=Sinorhizobium alkalisoli TaxID=1752398 RepID=UPI003CC93BB5
MGVMRHFFSLVVWQAGADGTRSSLPDPFAVQVPGFFDYLRDERGLRQSSIAHYRHYLRVFERHLADMGCDPKSLIAGGDGLHHHTGLAFRPYRNDQSR